MVEKLHNSTTAPPHHQNIKYCYFHFTTIYTQLHTRWFIQRNTVHQIHFKNWKVVANSLVTAVEQLQKHIWRLVHNEVITSQSHTTNTPTQRQPLQAASPLYLILYSCVCLRATLLWAWNLLPASLSLGNDNTLPTVLLKQWLIERVWQSWAPCSVHLLYIYSS